MDVSCVWRWSGAGDSVVIGMKECGVPGVFVRVC